jgi:hypothetical protein
MLSSSKLYMVVFLCAFGTLKSYAQSVDFEHLGKNIKGKLKPKKILKISGGLNSNFIFYNGNIGSGRKPFAYFLNGNLNASVLGISIPLSFTYTNLGFNYNYQLPQTPNRLSLHPKYKWITAHVGDVSMSFSPYTFNGYQFRGAGIDLSPKGKFKYSAFYGRLQKAVEFNGTNKNATSYERIGYAAKIGYAKNAYKFGAILFMEKDNEGSLKFKPDTFNIRPKENTALSFQMTVPLKKNLTVDIDYSASLLTSDSRTANYVDTSNVNYLIKLLGGKMTTNLYHAFKGQLNYTLGSSQLGVGIERIDPGYQTLGAYYFANDLQNITINFAQGLFKGKLDFSGNLGLQSDNLDDKKASATNRTVMAVNVNWHPCSKINISSQYSSFQTFTNIKPQFQLINQLTPFDNLDTLNFQQLSQTANINFNYTIASSKEKSQNLNLNFSFQDAFDKQGGVISEGNVSQFYNFSGSYSYTKVPSALTVTNAFNLTYNTIATSNILILGPTININKGLMKNRLKAGFSLSYNQNAGGGQKVQVASARTNVGYVIKKKHNLSLNSTMMFRKGGASTSISNPENKIYKDMTMTLAYNFRF